MKTRRALLAAALALILTSSGCAIGKQNFGEVLDAKLIANVKIGTSTKQDVLDLFGPPTSFNRVGAWFGYGVTGPDGAGGGGTKPWGWPADDVFTYEYREENEAFFTLIIFTYFDREVLSDRLMIFFDTNDVVKYLAFAKQTDTEFDEPDPEEPDEDD